MRRSGHYAFHPASEAEPLAVGAAALDVVAGPSLTTVTRRYGGYASLTVRLRAGSIAPELEWTVGPLPSPQDVVLRMDTDVANGDGDTFFTDANGREYVQRGRATRSTFVPAPIEEPYANPIGRDYYPTTVGAYVGDDGIQVSLLADRPQGAASLAPGALEMMLHRQAEACDELGNPEILSETIGVPGTPIIVRGVTLLAVTSAAGGPTVRRRLAAEAYHPVQVAFTGRVVDATRAATASLSLLSADLPPSIDLHKFGAASGGGGIDVRLAHAFDEGEDAAASVPVTVDLRAAFGGLGYKAATETAITGVPLSALRGGRGASAPSTHPRRGERIFGGPKFFDYDNLGAPGVEVPGAGTVTPPPLVPRPKTAPRTPVDKAGRVKLAPLEVRSVRLSFGGGEVARSE